MTISEKIAKVDKSHIDFYKFLADEEEAYAAMTVRTIVEIIVNSYTDYYNPGIKIDNNPSIMDQISELERYDDFQPYHIKRLHNLRKVGNKGAHQGEGDTVGGLGVRPIRPELEEEIRVWKEFLEEGKIKRNYVDEDKLCNGVIERKKSEVIASLLASIACLGAIVYFTYEKTTQFFTMGLYYEESGLLIYWACLVATLVLAAYLRPYGKLNKLIFNAAIVYFAAPRFYQVYLCFTGKTAFFEGIIYIAFSIAIVFVYYIITLFDNHQRGGVVGYN